MQREARWLREDYVLGHSAEEYERLRRQARRPEPVTRRLFRAIGLQPGWKCLDLGCGPGETMRLMGEVVGPSGEVTGLDRDAKARSSRAASINRNKSIPIRQSGHGERRRHRR